jgi:membrane protease YdiL (CAAX protease family)
MLMVSGGRGKKIGSIFMINLLQKNPAKAYIVSVLAISWLITGILFINPTIGLKYFAIIMFVPAILAIIFNKLLYTNRKESLLERVRKTNPKALLFGILYPIIFVILCAITAQMTGLGKLNVQGIQPLRVVITLAVTIIIGLFSAWGEEYGWRGYLLPELTRQLGKVKATGLVGIVWGLYHVPAVFLLAKTTGMSNPLLLCIVQAIVVFALSFPFSYCYYSSGNLIPVLFLHSVWNTINPAVLGNIYRNEPGIMTGNLLYINGEGVLGAIFGVILIIWFIKQFNKHDAIALEINT